MTEERQRRRRSTVYDFSDLKLHSDGTRVHKTSARNLHPRTAKKRLQTSRSWIARDAGGIFEIPKYKKKKKGADEDSGSGEDFGDIESEADDVGRDSAKKKDEEASDDGSEIVNGKRKKQVDFRKAKRRKFVHDDSFLAQEYASASFLDNVENPEHHEPSSFAFPDPSPDLLKCIHYFASELYEERGNLLNLSRKHRVERRRRRALRAKKLEKRDSNEDDSHSSSSSASASGSSSSSSSGGGSTSESESESESEIEEDESEEYTGPSRTQKAEAKAKAKGKGKEKEKKKKKKKKKKKGEEKAQHARRDGKLERGKELYRDMYKVLDGSAIVALGMLVQEQIAFLMKPQLEIDEDQDVEEDADMDSMYDDDEPDIDVGAVMEELSDGHGEGDDDWEDTDEDPESHGADDDEDPEGRVEGGDENPGGKDDEQEYKEIENRPRISAFRSLDESEEEDELDEEDRGVAIPQLDAEQGSDVDMDDRHDQEDKTFRSEDPESSVSED